MLIGLTFTTTSTTLAQCQLTCQQGVTIALPASGAVAITPQMVLATESGCGTQKLVSVFTQQGQTVPNNIVTCAYVGQTLNVSVVDVTSTEFCIGTIQVIDPVAPAIVCPTDITVNINNNSCATAVALPPALAVDNCNTPSVTHQWQFGTGQSVYANVPRGAYPVTYTATDASGNVATCQNTVHVMDNTSPVAVCYSQLTIALDEQGITVVPATQVSSQSYDNCGIHHLEIERTGQAWSSAIYVTCSDIGTTVPVTLKVVDDSGRTGTCPANLIVTEHIAPRLTCPADITLSCQDNIQNTTLTGMPQATDNCLIANTHYTDEPYIGACGVGYVLRTWRTTDVAGNVSTCVQRITLQSNAAVSVVFPPNTVVATCGGSTAPPATGYPLVTASGCVTPDVFYTDQVLPIAPPACYNIKRTWTVTNPCIFNPNDLSNGGYWTAEQTIEVKDNQAPVLTAPADLTVNVFGMNCGTQVTISQNAIATDCNPNIIITNNSIYSSSNGANASGYYPIGTYAIVFRAADGCGNVSTDTMHLTVRDINPPTPLCGSAYSLTLDNTGFAELTSEDVLVGVSDNCTPQQDISIALTPFTFTCSDIGVQSVQVRATDAAGNIGACTALVVVQDNQNSCQGTLTPVIKGIITTELGIPVSPVGIIVGGMLQDTVWTDSSGTYLVNNLTQGGTYTLQPSRNTAFSNGLTTYDMVLIRRHILGLELLNSPYKIIAADVNKNGTITTFDLVQIRQLILQQIQTLPNNQSWRFIDASYVFPEPTRPFAQAIPELMYIDNMNTSQLHKNWVAVKVGDVNNSALPNQLQTATVRHAHEVSLRTPEQHFRTGDYVSVPVYAHDVYAMSGYQGTLQFDTNYIMFEKLIPNEKAGITADNFGFPNPTGGMITTLWENLNDNSLHTDTELFTLRFRALQDGYLSQTLSLQSDYTEAIGFDADGTAHPLTLTFSDADTAAPLPTMTMSIAPNPFKDLTTLSIVSADAATITLTVSDATGKIYYTTQQTIPAGTTQVPLTAENLTDATGVLYVQVKTATDAPITQKIIRIR